MIPSCSHTGTPRHFHSSTTSGSASLITPRIRPSVSPRQSPSSLILPSIILDGEAPSVFVVLLFFAVTAFFMFTPLGGRRGRGRDMAARTCRARSQATGSMGRRRASRSTSPGLAAYAYDEGRLIGACARTQREL